MPDQGHPLTCQWCRNQPAAQVVIADWPAVGRHTSLVCDPCGDKAASDAHGSGVLLFRYQLTPIKEKADA
ncbi:hypothetical protein [Nonomuraea wenchangensis]|uniref:hypothetical protein n=1 Tax=Nonomuraea wenchangensis TaxID=568860 RepID=UPI003320B02E